MAASRALVRSEGAAAAPVRRWLPVNTLQPATSASPRLGWQAIKGLEERADPVEGCSELVRTMRRGLRPPPGMRPAPQSYWRRAASQAGRLAEYLSPEEACELLSTLADARLQWEGDRPSAKGLRRFADHAAQELGSFSPAQVSDLAWSMARLNFQHEDLLQSLSRAVEHTVRAERGRLSNEAACALLAAYRRIRVLDEAAMRSLSRLICRRLVREPLTPPQTAGVVCAFAELRARDLALFNATTLALCRPNTLEALEWGDLADVALSYASLRLHSASLSARVRRRLCDSAGVAFLDGDDAVGEGDALVEHPGPGPPGAAAPGAARDAAAAWEQLARPAPGPPPVQLRQVVVTRFLEAQLHLGRIAADDLAPLLPHLAHLPEGAASAELGVLLASVLGQGGHLWPWLWRHAARACSVDRRLAPRGLMSLVDALRAHLAAAAPALGGAALGAAARGGGRRGGARAARRGGAAAAAPAAPAEPTGRSAAGEALAQHVQVLSGALAQLWGALAQRRRAFSDAELRHVLAAVPPLLEAQGPLQRALRSLGLPALAGGAEDPLGRAAARAAAALGAEATRRCPRPDGDLAALLDRCGVDVAAAAREGRRLTEDVLLPGGA